jgi:transcriptional regulator
MSDLTDRELQTLRNWGNELEERAADEIDKLRKEVALADSMYKLVVLERDQLRQYLDAAQRRAESLREQLTLAESVRASQVAGLVEAGDNLREEVKRLTKIIDDAWGEA